eukprot:scaffold79637_cov54-Phaeocystis_antarctica.AAC.1
MYECGISSGALNASSTGLRSGRSEAAVARPCSCNRSSERRPCSRRRSLSMLLPALLSAHSARTAVLQSLQICSGGVEGSADVSLDVIMVPAPLPASTHTILSSSHTVLAASCRQPCALPCARVGAHAPCTRQYSIAHRSSRGTRARAHRWKPGEGGADTACTSPSATGVSSTSTLSSCSTGRPGARAVWRARAVAASTTTLSAPR